MQKISCLLLLCCCLFFRAYSQSIATPYTIRYMRGIIPGPEMEGFQLFRKGEWGRGQLREALVVNDTSAYQFPFSGNRGWMKKEPGKDFMLHASYTDWKNKVQLYQSHPGGTNKKYLIHDEQPDNVWVLQNDTIHLLGYTCYKAITKQNNDTMYYWYTPHLPQPIGPLGYTGLPGATLAIESRNRTRPYAIVAFAIDKVEASIVVPKKGIPVSKDEFEKILARLRNRF